MRKIIGSAIAATALIGCASPDSVTLEHRSELSAQTRGVQLDDEGRMSNVGMFGTTCQVSTDYAMMSDDFDYDSDSDTVVDAQDLPGVGMAAVVITPDQVNFTTPDRFPWSATKVVPAAVDAQLLDTGFVSLQVDPTAANDCMVAWYDNIDDDSVGGSQPVTANSLGIECDEESDLTADPQSRSTWVSTDSGVLLALPDGTVQLIDDTANARLAWDASAQALYVGGVGSEVVRAFELDGIQRWEVSLPGEITALTDMGVEGNAAVSVHTNAGGELIVIDGATGEIQADLPTPSAANQLDVSGNGKVLAVSLASSVHYFDILATE